MKETVCLVTGGFDPVHSGHIAYITSATKYSDHVVVGINSDQWLINKKKIYLMPWKERAAVIENLKSVSEVKENLINNTDSKSELCNSLSERLSDSYANELGKENVLKNMLIATLTDEIIIEDIRNTTYEQ